MASLLVLAISVFCSILVNSELISFDESAGTVSLSISQGHLLGKRIDSYDKRTGYGFLGIPFGAPPVGSLRFSKPIAASSWFGVKNVTVKGVACPAVGKLTYKRPEGGPMSEDCLHAYVYASKKCLVKGGCAIMFVLHGGKYNFESPVVYDDDVIVHNFASDDQDVVVIIPAYRLENFGFLNIAPGMNTSAVPNAAVWDLLLALQWTRREAHHFGGDPKKITLFGHSAGAQFADTISTSPHFTGLFRSAVLMSGTDTAYEAGAKALVTGNSLASWVTARLLKCADKETNQKDVVSVEAVIACMRAKTWQEIVDANIELNSYPEDYNGPHADGPGGILPLPPNVLALTRPAIPVMIGTTSAEMHETKYALNSDGTADIAKVTELCEGFGYGTGYAHTEEMTKRCIDHYMQGENVMDLQQDVMFFLPTFVTARNLLANKRNKVFMYSFTYTGIGEAFKKYVNVDKEDHPSHSEDFVYMLGIHRGNFTERDYEIEKIYSGMVLNFVKTGYPNPGAGQPAWKPFTTTGREYYEIDFDDNNRMPGMRKGYQTAGVKMWVDDANKYGGKITQPDEFPSHYDQFVPLDMLNAYISHHKNKSVAHDKTLEVEQECYKIWTEYINKRRSKHLQGQKMFRSTAIEQNLTDIHEADHTNIMEILLICVSAVLIFLLLQCCCHCMSVSKERKGYEEF